MCNICFFAAEGGSTTLQNSVYVWSPSERYDEEQKADVISERKNVNKDEAPIESSESLALRTSSLQDVQDVHRKLNTQHSR